MKKALILGLAGFVCSAASASTEHYVRYDGAHVQHLKITRIGGEIRASMDVDFEPTPAEAAKGIKPCSVEVRGEAKAVSDTGFVFREQVPEERRYCEVRVQLSGDEARTSQSKQCEYFLAHFCRFDSEGKALMKVK